MGAPTIERPLVAIVGPTAAGKTGLAIAVCRHFDAELVGVDASQVYRRLDIGTGKATASELGGVRHHLIDVVDPDARFDAAAYARHADAAIADIVGRGHRVVLCGGTGLYLRALIDGLCDAPPVEAGVRAAIASRIEAGELSALHGELAEVDPTAAARIAPGDGQRIERALGVFRTTGRPLSAWQAEHAAAPPRYPVRIFGVDWPREVLQARIERRVDAMFAAGWVDEVRGLIADGYGPALRSMQALGYRFIVAALAGEMTLDEARHRTLVATRRYAKRQRTWFRKASIEARFTGPIEPGEVIAALGAVWS